MYSKLTRLGETAKKIKEASRSKAIAGVKSVGTKIKGKALAKAKSLKDTAGKKFNKKNATKFVKDLSKDAVEDSGRIESNSRTQKTVGVDPAKTAKKTRRFIYGK